MEGYKQKKTIKNTWSEYQLFTMICSYNSPDMTLNGKAHSYHGEIYWGFSINDMYTYQH